MSILPDKPKWPEHWTRVPSREEVAEVLGVTVNQLAGILARRKLTIKGLLKSLNGPCEPVSEEVLRKAIQGMGYVEYERARKEWGPRFPYTARFKLLYGKTFCEIRDGVQRGHREWASEEDIRRLLQENGISRSSEYDKLRKKWGPQFPHSCSFVKIYGYGRSFAGVRDNCDRVWEPPEETEPEETASSLVKIQLWGYECTRCGHQWVPRGIEPADPTTPPPEPKREPKVCPSCKSPYWNKPRQKRKRAE